MTVRRVYQIDCDHRGCPSQFTAPAPGIYEARLVASDHGWQSIPKGRKGLSRTDLCPAHREAPSQTGT